jgi:predicted ABC-type transport system involved in lysophospholipase L1 biosynthesis ATPase subunit
VSRAEGTPTGSGDRAGLTECRGATVIIATHHTDLAGRADREIHLSGHGDAVVDPSAEG